MEPAPGTPSAPRAPRRAPDAPWLLGLVAVVTAFTWPLVSPLDAVGGELDWKYFQGLWEADWRSVSEYGQLPLWNPWHCGGTPQLANPQTQFFSLAAPIAWLWGPLVAVHAHIWLHYVAGAWGAYALARALGLRGRGGFAAGAVFALSGFFAMRAGGGHSAFMPFFFLPWLAFFYERMRRHASAAVALGMVAGLALLEGGMYPAALGAGMLVLLAVHDLVAFPAHRRNIVRGAIVAAVVAVAAAAIKLGPMAEFVREFPREVPVKDSLGLARMLSMFVSRQVGRQCEGCVYVWPEYVNYVGPLVFGIFALSLLRLRDVRWRRAFLVALGAAAIMSGDHGAFSPYVLLHHVPPYDSLRVPARWGIIVTLQMALLWGAFISEVPARLKRIASPTARWPMTLAVGLVLANAWHQGMHNRWLFGPGFREVPPPVTAGAFRQEKGGAWSAFVDVRRNVGTVDCYENVQVPRAAGLWFGAAEQVRVVEGQGSARLIRFTPNAWDVEVDAQSDVTVALNMNFHRGWRLAGGAGQVAARENQLVVRAGAGRQVLRLEYVPAFFGVYAGVSALMWALGLVLLWRRRGEVMDLAPTLDLPPPMAEPEPSPSHVLPPPAPPPEARMLVASALVAGVLAGWGTGAFEAADLVARNQAPADGRAGFVLLGLLAEGGAWAMLLALVTLVVRTLAWRGSAMGRAVSWPLRMLLAVDEPDAHASEVFARTGAWLVGLGSWVAGVTWLGTWAARAFNARELAAALVAVLGLVMAMLAVVVGVVSWRLLRSLGGVLDGVGSSRVAAVMPWVALLVGCVAMGIPAARPVLKDTDLRPALYPLATVTSAVVLSLLVRVSLRAAIPTILVAGILGMLGVALLPGSEAGAAWVERGMLAGPLVRGLRARMDGDRDGYARVLGGGDCDDSRADVHPGALDIPGNGVDEDCSGSDFQVPRRDASEHVAPLPAGVGPYKNILLVIVDTLRADRLHLYGNARPTSPFLDELAAQSAMFENAYANGVRSHRSIPSILTGRYPSRLHMAESRSELMTLLPVNTSIAERLTPRGWTAASFILEKYFEGQEGLTQGFDFFNPRRVDPAYNDWSRPQGEAVVNAAIRWIEAQPGPWLAWTHLYDPHLYWHDTPFGADEIARYDAAVRYVDTHVARLVQYVKSRPDAASTIIVFTSDHGQGLGTHGEWGHGQQLWQEDIHVPLVIHAPGFPPQRVRTVVENVDIVPTLLNLLGLSSGLDPMLDGMTLVPLLSAGDSAAGGKPGVAVVEGLTDKKQPKNRRVVIRQPYKLLVDLDAGTTHLFDLDKDPQEKNNLSTERKDVVAELRELLATHGAVSAAALAPAR